MTQLVPFDDRVYTDLMKLPKTVDSHYSCVKSYISDSFLAQSSTVPVASNFTVDSTLISDFSSLAAVFDQYRIDMVEFFLRPHASESPIASTQPTGQLAVVIDYDDTNVLGSIAVADAYANCITVTPLKTVRRCFRPRSAVAGYGGGAFSSYSNVPFPWTDCTSTSMKGYGIKTIIETGTAGALQTYDLQARLFVEFRSTR
jgi:hypothetical protein